ncbi:MAG: tRNA (N(6)-L-threonylcarbamoyladenosine(37)-C(2))-methylthiotransferase [Candidatus Pacearchaeota archaeon]
MSEIKNIYIESYGCSANQNNAEILKGILTKSGFNIVINERLADILIINTCIVKGPTEKKMERRISDLSKLNKSLIVAGCMPEVRSKELGKLKNVFLLGTHHYKDILKLIYDIRNKKYKIEEYLSYKKEIKLCLEKIKKNEVIGITQISEGCLGNCNFCITKLAKGKLFSYPQDKIIENIKKDLKSGCKEIWITSQDNASYGLERGKRELPDLLEKILSLKENFFVRVGMMNPNNVLPILNDLIRIYKNDKMFKFLHIPLQSGSNRILKEMNRYYKVEDFLYIVKKFRKEIPNITISTDIIVAYPSETEKDFKETIKVIKKIKPDIINYTKYWPMKGTKAAKEKQIDVKIAKERIKKLSEICKKISEEENKKWINWKGKIIIDEFKNNLLIARNIFYKPIVLKTDDKKLLGKFVNVRVINSFTNYLLGEIIK